MKKGRAPPQEPALNTMRYFRETFCAASAAPRAQDQRPASGSARRHDQVARGPAGRSDPARQSHENGSGASTRGFRCTDRLCARALEQASRMDQRRCASGNADACGEVVACKRATLECVHRSFRSLACQDPRHSHGSAHTLAERRIPAASTPWPESRYPGAWPVRLPRGIHPLVASGR